jgi:hypothetical protein
MVHGTPVDSGGRGGRDPRRRLEPRSQSALSPMRPLKWGWRTGSHARNARLRVERAPRIGCRNGRHRTGRTRQARRPGARAVMRLPPRRLEPQRRSCRSRRSDQSAAGSRRLFARRVEGSSPPVCDAHHWVRLRLIGEAPRTGGRVRAHEEAERPQRIRRRESCAYSIDHDRVRPTMRP